MNRWAWLLLALAGWGGAVESRACTVPVFRFAFEQWPPDAFEVVLFHRGDLSAAQEKLLSSIQPRVDEVASVPNIRIHQVDLDGNPDPRWLGWWDEHKPTEAEEAHLVVFYPASTLKLTPVWICAFEERAVKQVLDSPARWELAKRLRAGDSAVWLLVECGDEQKDAAARQLLEQRLAHLNQTLEPPQVKAQDIQAGYLSIRPEDLKIHFSLITLAAGDLNEAVLRETLLNSEEDLKQLAEPMVFPVFGRGRALPALVGRGINTHMIDEAGLFLTGPCSCQVKRQNPGFDLLTAIDWDALLQEQIRTFDDRAQRDPFSANPATPAPAEDQSAGAASPTDTKDPPNATPSMLAWLPLVGVPILLVGGLILLAGRRDS